MAEKNDAQAGEATKVVSTPGKRAPGIGVGLSLIDRMQDNKSWASWTSMFKIGDWRLAVGGWRLATGYASMSLSM